MKRTTTIEMKEIEHGLYGFGTVKYEYEEEGNVSNLTITTEAGTISKSGKAARNLYHKIHRTSLRVPIAVAKKCACTATGIDVHELKVITRKRAVVFARAAMYWYLTEELNFSLGHAAEEIGGPTNHATVINAVNLYNKEGAELSEEEAEWKLTFKKLIKENSLC